MCMFVLECHDNKNEIKSFWSLFHSIFFLIYPTEERSLSFLFSMLRCITYFPQVNFFCYGLNCVSQRGKLKFHFPTLYNFIWNIFVAHQHSEGWGIHKFELGQSSIAETSTPNNNTCTCTHTVTHHSVQMGVHIMQASEGFFFCTWILWKRKWY